MAHRTVVAWSALLSGAAVVALVHCAASEESSMPGDGGDRDARTDAPVDASGAAPTVIVAHAAASGGDVRLCFATAGKALLDTPALPHKSSEPMPQANYPGIPVGGIVSMPDVLALDGSTLVPYAISARAILSEVDTKTGERRCPQMICSGMASCLKAADYVELPPIQTSELRGGPVLLALVDDADAGVGPLRLVPLRLSPVAASAGQMTAQFAQLAPRVHVAGLYVRGSSGQTTPITADADIRQIPFLSVSSTFSTPTPGDVAGYGTTALGVAFEGDGGTFEMTLDVIQKLSSPLNLPDEFFQRRAAFVVVMAGDPDPSIPPFRLQDGAINAGYDGRGLHLLALPTSQ